MKMFLNKDILEDIIGFYEYYPNLFKIICAKSNVILDMSEENLDELLKNSESVITQCINGYDISHRTSEGILERLKNDISLMICEPRALFFLDVEKEEAEQMRLEYGIIVISSKDIDDTIFNKGIFTYRIDDGIEYSGTIQNQWATVMQEIRLLPFNSLVISDPYLFNSANHTIEDCILNIQGFLCAILPQHLSGEMHIVFFTDSIPPGRNLEINNAIGRIASAVRIGRDYDIVIEYVLCSCLHQRKAISNYYVIVIDKGLLTFKRLPHGNNPKIKSVGVNKIIGFSVYENAKNSVGQSEYSIITRDLKDLSKIYNNCKALCNSDNPDPTKRILGTRHRDKSINNRLINNYE